MAVHTAVHRQVCTTAVADRVAFGLSIHPMGVIAVDLLPDEVPVA